MLRREALVVDRWNRLHPDGKPRVPYVATVLRPKGGPIVAATDWIKALPDLVRPWIARHFVSLGTDGFAAEPRAGGDAQLLGVITVGSSIRRLNPISVPPPAGRSARIVPPIASTRLEQTNRPMPDPATRRELPGSR